MQIQIVAKRLELTDSQREIVDRRLRFALGRFVSRIRRVEVLLADVNGPRGGIDTTCQIVVRIVPRGEVRAEVTDIGVGVAVSRAAQRISRGISTELQRRRAPRRVRPARYADGAEDRAAQG